MAAGQLGIGGHRHRVSQPLGQQRGLEIAALRIVDMREHAPVTILRLAPHTQPDPFAIALHQGVEMAPGRFGEGLGLAPMATALGGIDTDQPHAAPIHEAQRVAIDDARDLHQRQTLRCRTEGQRLKSPEDGNEKGAHQGRLFHVLGKSHRIPVAPAYLAPNTPKRCLKRSMRPPVSSTFCLPV